MQTLGAYLRHERRSLGVQLAEVAAATRVPEASVRSIEEDRFDDLPGEVFVRGFVRAYARYLGLDPEALVERLDRPAPQPTALPLVHISKTYLRRRRIPSPALLLVLVITVLALSLIFRHPVMPALSASGPAPTSDSAG